MNVGLAIRTLGVEMSRLGHALERVALDGDEAFRNYFNSAAIRSDFAQNIRRSVEVVRTIPAPVNITSAYMAERHRGQKLSLAVANQALTLTTTFANASDDDELAHIAAQSLVRAVAEIGEVVRDVLACERELHSIVVDRQVDAGRKEVCRQGSPSSRPRTC